MAYLLLLVLAVIASALITTAAQAATMDPGEQDAVLLAASPGVNGVAFSPDGKLLAGAYGDGSVRLWDPATGQPHDPALQAGSGPQSSVTAVAFGPGDRLAGAYADGALRMWTVAAGGGSALAGGGWFAVAAAGLAIGLAVSAVTITMREIRRQAEWRASPAGRCRRAAVTGPRPGSRG